MRQSQAKYQKLDKYYFDATVIKKNRQLHG